MTTEDGQTARVGPTSLFGPYHIRQMDYYDEPPIPLSPRGRLLARHGWAGTLQSVDDDRIHHFPVELTAGTHTAQPHTDCTDAFLARTALCGWGASEEGVKRPRRINPDGSINFCAHCDAAAQLLLDRGLSLADIAADQVPIPVNPAHLMAAEQRVEHERVARAAARAEADRQANLRAEQARWVPTKRAMLVDHQTHRVIEPISLALCGADGAHALPAPVREPSQQRWRPDRLIYSYDPLEFPDCESCELAWEWVAETGGGLVGITSASLPLVPPPAWVYIQRARRMAAEPTWPASSRPRPDADIDDERISSFDWEFARGADLVYGSSVLTDGAVILERSTLLDIVAIREAISGSRTWGDLVGKLPARLLAAVRERLDDYDLEDRGLAIDTPVADLPPDLPLAVRGFEDLAWPELPEYAMHWWLPTEIRDEFGHEVGTLLDGEFSVIDSLDQLIHWLTKAGAQCESADRLFVRAYP